MFCIPDGEAAINKASFSISYVGPLTIGPAPGCTLTYTLNGLTQSGIYDI